MLSADFTTNGMEEVIATRASQLFCNVYGLSWSDSHLAAMYEAENGQRQMRRVLNLLGANNFSWQTAVSTVRQIDSNHLMVT